MKTLILAFCALLANMAIAEPLARRADTGISISPPQAAQAARVMRVREGSALAAAGVRRGDEILAIDGAGAGDPAAFLARWRGLRTGDAPRFPRRWPNMAVGFLCAAAPPNWSRAGRNRDASSFSNLPTLRRLSAGTTLPSTRRSCRVVFRMRPAAPSSSMASDRPGP